MQKLSAKRSVCLMVSGFALSFAVFAGCGGDAVPGAVPTFPAKGILTFDGKPFGPARLSFRPDDATQTFTPSALVDAAGEFTVTTYKAGDGIPAGTYKVMLSSDPMLQTGPHPQVYDKPETTLLTVTIKSSGTNDIELDMASSAGPLTTGFMPGGINVPGGADPSKGFAPVVAPGAEAAK